MAATLPVEGDAEPHHPAMPRLSGTDLLLILMAVIWGVNISVVKYGTLAMPPLAYNGVRVLLAAATLLAIGGMMSKAWPGRRDVLSLLALGMLGNGVYQVLFVEGISRTRAGNAALVLAAVPAFIAILSWVSGLEKASPRAVLGIALSVGGVGIVVVGAGTAGIAGTSWLGDSLVLAGCICWALFTVLLKPFTHRVDGIHVAGLTMAGGLLPLLIMASPDILVTDWPEVPLAAWGSIVFSGLGALVLAYLFWYRGVRVLGPTRTAMFGNLQPMIALVFAWFLLGEIPTPLQGLGAGGIVTGLLLSRS